ncbi:MAG: hypothetical protein J6W84_02840 [Bacteroidales bacterium]|nr:hypothetical protein [Bacteroidales bacterium]
MRHIPIDCDIVVDDPNISVASSAALLIGDCILAEFHLIAVETIPVGTHVFKFPLKAQKAYITAAINTPSLSFVVGSNTDYAINNSAFDGNIFVRFFFKVDRGF